MRGGRPDVPSWVIRARSSFAASPLLPRNRLMSKSHEGQQETSFETS
jgi:hypothetical protein